MGVRVEVAFLVLVRAFNFYLIIKTIISSGYSLFISFALSPPTFNCILGSLPRSTSNCYMQVRQNENNKTQEKRERKTEILLIS